MYNMILYIHYNMLASDILVTLKSLINKLQSIYNFSKFSLNIYSLIKKPAEFQQVSNCYSRLLCDARFVNFFMKINIVHIIQLK
ncbi:hypothetical protein EXW34_02630 [Bacillus mycoides]|nr:hypothetical protein [Bacillus mycoides]QWI20315.1 hypothetical protein EXW34_02630 [Bacillus mycoides]